MLHKLKAIAPFILVILIYALLRLIYLDHLAHPDERHWVGRSLNFLEALKSGNFEHTYQKEHPGVMTMWAGTLGYLFRYPDITSNLGGNNPNAHTTILQMWGWGLEPPSVLVALRATKVLVQTAFFALALRFLVPLIGRNASLLFGILIALSTTLYGWDSWLHIDGLATMSGFAGIVVTCYAGEKTNLFGSNTRNIRWIWLLAGAVTATSWLNRSTSIILVGAVGLVLLIQLYRQYTSATSEKPVLSSGIKSSFKFGLIWVVGAIASSILLFPALWVAPRETLSRVFGVILDSLLGRKNEIYVFDQINDPGWLYYPTEIVIRTTPFEWLGIAALLVTGFLVVKKNLVTTSTMRLILVLIIVASVYFLGLSTTSKKAPQYLSFIYAALTFTASIGIYSLCKLLLSKGSIVGKVATYCLLISTIGYSLVATVQALPYKDTYNNPIGLRLLDESYSYTIRPGYPEIADFFIDLDAQPPTKIGFSSGGFTTILRYHIPPDLEVSAMSWKNTSSPQQWMSYDWQIVGVNYPTNEPSPLDYGIEPSHVVVVQGRVLWEIYPNEVVPPYRTALPQTACTTTFGNHVTLYQVASTTEGTGFYFYSENGAEVDVEIYRISNESRSRVGKNTLVPVREHMLMELIIDGPTLNADTDTDLNQYEIHVVDTETGETLLVTSAGPFEGQESATFTSDCFEQPAPGASAIRND